MCTHSKIEPPPPRLFRMRPAWMTGNFENDFPEDSSHENGNYCNKCMSCHVDFVGYKRRFTCRRCQEEFQAKLDTMTSAEREEFERKRQEEIQAYMDSKKETKNEQQH